MYTGMRVTDAVTYYRHHGEMRGSIHVVKMRRPDKLRWRSAVHSVTHAAAALGGRDRMRVEEPVREIILDLNDKELRRDVVLDARKSGLDLDRGEILPRHSFGDLNRMVYLSGTSLDIVRRYVRLPDDFFAPVDTAGITVVSRALADHFRKRSHKITQALAATAGAIQRVQYNFMQEKAEHDADLGRRWGALAKALVVESK